MKKLLEKLIEFTVGMFGLFMIFGLPVVAAIIIR